MIDKQLTNLIIQLEKQIVMQNLKNIYKFTYRYFIFNIKSIMDLPLQQEFLKFLKEENNKKGYMLPHEICNFFLQNKIKFSIHFHYIIKAGLKSNFTMLQEAIRLRKELYKINKKYNIKIGTKKFIDKRKNKEFKQLFFEMMNKEKLRLIRFSLDFNILWKPRHKVESNNDKCFEDFSWLCFQLIIAKELDK